MEMIIDIIGIALFSNFLTGWFTPLNPLRERVTGKLIRMMVKHNMLWMQPLISVYSCAKCIAFWGALIYTTNLSYALICSILAQIIKYIIYKTDYEAK